MNLNKIRSNIHYICMGLYTCAIAVFNMLPLQMQQSFDQQDLRWGSIALMIIGMVGKYFDKDSKVSGDD